MKIRMNVTAAGPTFTYTGGSVADVPDQLAKQWLEAGYAVAHDPNAKLNGTSRAREAAAVAASGAD